jgi:CRISPR system Cascade subunit CasE
VNLYLARLVLNPGNRAVQRDINDCQAMHRRVMSAFDSLPSASPRKEMGILYRLESVQDVNTVILFTQSNRIPDWTRLPAGYLVEHSANPAVKEITTLLQRLADNQRYIFELAACPCQKAATSTKEERLAGNKKNGRRIPLQGFATRIGWLERQGARHGFRVITADASPQPAIHGGYNAKKGLPRLCGGEPEGDRMKHQGVVYKGILEITHPELFQDTLREGIGPARAYGFGMLMLLRRVVG